jgi:TolB-like protein/DNA-binding winged helix-turn-helix (wHTH) protein/Flp pilus assembly protein TadD
LDSISKSVAEKGAAPRKFAFAEFVLDLDRGTLLKNEADVPLRPKCFEVLQYLVEHHGVLLSKQEILAAVWTGVIVTEDSLTHCLIEVRRALGDETKEMVRTVPRRGYLFDVPVTVHKPGEGQELLRARGSSKRHRKPSRWSVKAVSVLALAIFAIWISGRQGADETLFKGPAFTALPTSVAVLPFVDMSPESDQEYFAHGISEEVLHLLAQIPDLIVIARTSSFSFEGQNLDIETIAQRLNVANVLEGSVRKDGDQVRVTAQLVDASNSAHMWSQTYDRTLDNIFSVQSEIAGAVAGVLEVRLLGEAIAAEKEDRNAQAWDQYLKGRFFYSRRGTGDIDRAEKHFQKALDIDPQLAVAWVGLAATTGVQTSQGKIPREEGRLRSKAALDKALVLDPYNAEAHMRISAYFEYRSQHDQAQQHFDNAMKYGQNNALVHAIAAGGAWKRGDIEQAIELQRRAAVLDPLGFANHGNLAQYLYWSGHYDEARDEFHYSMALSPEHADEHQHFIGLSRLLQQRYAEAEAMLQKIPPGIDRDQLEAMLHHALGPQDQFDAVIQRISADSSLDAFYYLAEIFAFKGDFDESIRWLASGSDRLLEDDANIAKNYLIFTRMKYSPFMAPIHYDPRWEDWLVNTENRFRVVLATNEVQ